MSNGSNVWKWLAAFLAGVVLAGMPAAFVSFTAPTRSDLANQSDKIVAVQVQIAQLQERLLAQGNTSQVAIQNLQDRITELQVSISKKGG